MERPQIAAVVLQYGQWQKTIDCIESLLASTLMPSWIIIVDNASADDSSFRIESWLKTKIYDSCKTQIIFIAQQKNCGYAAGNNIGLKAAIELGAEAFLIINNDAYATPTALQAMWNRLSTSPRAGLCGPLLVYPREGYPVQCCAGGHTNYISGLSKFTGAGLDMASAQALPAKKVEKELNFICGACVMASRQFVEKVGLLDEGYFLYCEEQDWVLRANKRFDLVYAQDAVVFHHEGAATGWSRHSFQWNASIRLMRSRLRLAWIHHPWLLPSVAVCCGFAASRLLVKKIAIKIRTKLLKK